MATNVSADAIRQKLLEAQNKGRRDDNTPRKSTGDNASYAFWNIPVGQQATLRFLPDLDPDNLFFWVNREVIKLPFQGVVGGDYPTTKQVEVTVPCVDMFDMTCPIVSAIRPWWKGDDDQKALARRYYKKKSYIFQGFVVNSPFNEENVPENPVRRFVLNPSLYEIVSNSLMDPEMEANPTDYIEGRDFNIKKTQKGEYANYSSSTWSFRSRSLSETELLNVEQHGLFNLKEFKGPVPDADGVAAIKAMFEASLAGDPFDMESFGQFYRPYTSRDQSGDSDGVTAAARTAFQTGAVAAPIKEAAPVASTPVATTEAEEAPATTGSAAKSSAHDILERIKNRAK